MITYTKLKLDFHQKPEQQFLIIYTGGTIGMRVNEEGQLVPFNFAQFVDLVPELKQFKHNFTIFSFDELIDSADMTPEHWVAIADIISENYAQFDGFIVLQGTDTMAYAASGVSFLLENLHKPVIFTGAQLPIGAIRNDARKNLISSIDIAAQREDGEPVIQEVTIFFDEILIRGTRARKVQSTHLDAFQSENYPELAHAGVILEFNKLALTKSQGEFRSYSKLCRAVSLLKLFPGITGADIAPILSRTDLQGIVIETFGAGNASTNESLLEEMGRFIARGGIIINVSQCDGGQVMQKMYQTGNKLDKIGVISGKDMTSEAALAKLMFVLGNYKKEEVEIRLGKSLRGEMS